MHSMHEFWISVYIVQLIFLPRQEYHSADGFPVFAAPAILVESSSSQATHLQVSGFISSKDGTKKIALSGKWNSHLDMQKCDEEGELMPGSEPQRLWTVSTKPKERQIRCRFIVSSVAAHGFTQRSPLSLAKLLQDLILSLAKVDEPFWLMSSFPVKRWYYIT